MVYKLYQRLFNRVGSMVGRTQRTEISPHKQERNLFVSLRRNLKRIEITKEKQKIMKKKKKEKAGRHSELFLDCCNSRQN